MEWFGPQKMYMDPLNIVLDSPNMSKKIIPPILCPDPDPSNLIISYAYFV